jgi:hypothetical protein
MYVLWRNKSVRILKCQKITNVTSLQENGILARIKGGDEYEMLYTYIISCFGQGYQIQVGMLVNQWILRRKIPLYTHTRAVIYRVHARPRQESGG